MESYCRIHSHRNKRFCIWSLKMRNIALSLYLPLTFHISYFLVKSQNPFFSADSCRVYMFSADSNMIYNYCLLKKTFEIKIMSYVNILHVFVVRRKICSLFSRLRKIDYMFYNYCWFKRNPFGLKIKTNLKQNTQFFIVPKIYAIFFRLWKIDRVSNMCQHIWFQLKVTFNVSYSRTVKLRYEKDCEKVHKSMKFSTINLRGLMNIFSCGTTLRVLTADLEWPLKSTSNINIQLTSYIVIRYLLWWVIALKYFCII